ELEQLKTNFISTISHEFKTPLTSIMMGTSLLNDGTVGRLNTEQGRILISIEEDCCKLSNLVDDLLYMSKIESKDAAYDMKYVSINELVDEATKPFYIQSASKGVSLHVVTPLNLPKVYVDREKIIWVINNLLGNALKYTNNKDEISVGASVQNEKILITISDTGIGIPGDYLEKIFDQFVQVENSDLEIRGTGLGLFIAREIVRSHGGKIWCKSQLDKGSSFTFSLPLNNSTATKI
ncbi:MAG: HAMP domain-containing sensor histidine kinase, partial [Thermotaleaceae bacterium]